MSRPRYGKHTDAERKAYGQRFPHSARLQRPTASTLRYDGHHLLAQWRRDVDFHMEHACYPEDMEEDVRAARAAHARQQNISRTHNGLEIQF